MLRNLMSLWRMPLFDVEGGGGAGGGAAGGDGGAGGAGSTVITFENEAALMRRIGQATKVEQEKMAKDLGFETVEAMKEAAKMTKEAGEKAKTDLEKANDAKLLSDKTAADALSKLKTTNINTEIKLLAVELNFHSREDAIALVDRSQITYDDKTEKVTGVKEALESLAKDRPHLVKQGQGGPAGSPGSGGNGGRQGGSGGDSFQDGAEMAKKINEKNKDQSKNTGW